MNRKCIHMIVLVFLLVSARSTLGQDWGFTLSAGGASVQMNDLKDLQEHILSTYPVDGKITSSFPPYTTATLTVVNQLYDHIQIGGGYGFSTTGGKSSYADYSGDISTEMNATSHRLRAYISYMVLGGDRIDLALNGTLEANFTSLTIQSYYSIYNYGDGVSNSYRSFSPSGSIGGDIMYKFEKVSVGIEAGYLVDLKGDLNDADDGDPLLDPTNREQVLQTDWTGWFARLKFQIWLNF